MELQALQRWATGWLPVLLDAAMKGTVLLAVAGLAVTAMRKASAAARQMVWVLALAGMLALPLLSRALPSWQVLPNWIRPEAMLSQPAALAVETPGQGEPAVWPSPPAAQIDSTWAQTLSGSPAIGPAPQAAVASETPTATPPPRAARRDTSVWAALVPWVLVAWAAGAIVCLLPLAVGRVSLWRLSRASWRMCGGAWETLGRRAAQAVGLRADVVLLQSDSEPMPMVWGIFRPRLMLPAKSDAWPEERKWVVLLHELAHARRYDCLTKFIAHLACAAYWFNPLAWWAFKRMQGEAETACDDLVLAAGRDSTSLAKGGSMTLAEVGSPALPPVRPSDYATHLLEIASGLRAGMLTAYSSIAMARRSRLEGRVLAILDEHRNRRSLTRWGLLIVAILVAGLAVPISILKATAAEEKKTPSATQPATRPAVPAGAGVYWLPKQLVAKALSSRPVDEKLLAAVLRQAVMVQASYWAEGEHGGGIATTKPRPDVKSVRLVRRQGGDVPQEWIDILKAPLEERPKVDVMLLFAVPEELRADRARALAQADEHLRAGLLKLAEKFPFMTNAQDWEREVGHPAPRPDPDNNDRLGFGLASDRGKTAGPTPVPEKFSIFAVMEPPHNQDGQLAMTMCFAFLGLEGQCGTGRGNAELAAQLEKLLAEALAPLRELDDKAAKIIAAQLSATQPATQAAGGKLEFRIAPSPSAMDKAELASCRAWLKAGRVGFWWKGGPIAGRMPNHAWLPIAGELTNADLLVTGEYEGQKYVLVSDKPGQTMLPGEGKDAWGLAKVYATTDGSRPAVSFELDDRGAELFAAFTKANIDNALAIVVNGKVVSAPVLKTALGKQGMIVGRFTEQEVKDLVQALKGGMPPTAKPATQPAAAPGARGGETQPAGQGEWSAAVNGLQARIILRRMEVINGTPILSTFLELRNASDRGNAMKLSWAAKKEFRVTEANGRELPKAIGSYDGLQATAKELVVPHGSTLSLDISCRGLGIPGDQAGLIDLGVRN